MISDDDSEVIKFIKEIIESRIRPFVQEDGGDVVFNEFDEESGVLSVTLRGSCTGCPSSEVTLKQGIERMMKYYVAEVKQVISGEDDMEVIK